MYPVDDCVQGHARFRFGCIEYGTKGPIGRIKKPNVYANYKRKGKYANGIFRKGNRTFPFLLTEKINDRIPKWLTNDIWRHPAWNANTISPILTC